MVNSTNSTINETSGMQLTERIILSIGACFILFINSLVIVALFSNKKIRQRAANILICSQACIDFLFGLLYIPVHLIETYHDEKTFTPYVVFYFIFVSLFNLLALSGDRYLALTRPFLHHRTVDRQRTVRLLFVIWLTPLFMTLLPLSWNFESHLVAGKAWKWYIRFCWGFMLSLVCLMTLLYMFVTRSARKTIQSKRRSIDQRSYMKKSELAQKEVRVVHLFGLLLFFFVAAYLPIIYMNFCDIIGRPDYMINSNVLELISNYLLTLNSIANPILCIILKNDYFRVIVTMLRLDKTRMRAKSTSSTKSDATECVDGFDGEDTSRRISKLFSLKKKVKETKQELMLNLL